MSHDHEALAAEISTVVDSAPQSGPIPDFLTRARRILGGDIRKEDYLPITPEVQRAVDFEMTYVRGHLKVEPAPEVEAQQLKGWLLSFHHGGENIIYIENEKGVIVLAVGLDQIGEFFKSVSYSERQEVTTSCPEPF